jgi:hypothetical protein
MSFSFSFSGEVCEKPAKHEIRYCAMKKTSIPANHYRSSSSSTHNRQEASHHIVIVGMKLHNYACLAQIIMMKEEDYVKNH